LWLIALISFPIGFLIIKKRSRSSTLLVHLSGALAALGFLVLVPATIVLIFIKVSAADIAGDKYCFYQQGRSRLLTRNVADLSFIDMLGRRSGYFVPPHVTLITSDRIWLWSFRVLKFVPWQQIDTGRGFPWLDGRTTLGQPRPDHLKKCLQELSPR
jgi:hypothetical protein